ncbi:hypothetical protein [Bradyrhizobium sp. BWA-3-5]|uniref:hypothetical protein n=1 Tax=Bradyrhizobium sp. BWA-3-5 TaxID=3080013 RepID=UPI00293F62A6|nr:hypothetical protein [Bradyrhizobium sp. BWA-3-5]WOH63879.1 hypothetical protein RX331_24815 [Bradyrhizobium sp. BWA-3-5]
MSRIENVRRNTQCRIVRCPEHGYGNRLARRELALIVTRHRLHRNEIVVAPKRNRWLHRLADAVSFGCNGRSSEIAGLRKMLNANASRMSSLAELGSPTLISAVRKVLQLTAATIQLILLRQRRPAAIRAMS